MSDSRPLLLDPEDPHFHDNVVEVLSKRYVETRKHWKIRFIISAVVGTTLFLHLTLAIAKWRHSFTYHYLVHGRSPSKLSPAEAEGEFLKVLDSTNYARNWSYQYTQEQHLLGQNYGLVKWTQDKFKEYGLVDTHVETYDVYLNKPKDHALRLLSKKGKVLYEATLEEDALPEDPTSQNDTVPTFHGYSANGNVTASYFYANYGRKEDFDALLRLGVNMTGKIAIIRYGIIYRGLKVKFAQDVGASGVVIYSDPGDDGEFIPQNGYKQYPHGPARNEASVQRGSVMYLSYGPGDPTTPGYASKGKVKRQDPHKTIPRIPSLPISYREIKPILAELNGKGVKGLRLGPDWVGKLEGYDYSIGLSPKEEYDTPLLNLFNEQEYSIIPIHNVFGTIKGINEDEVIIVGNHRDAWIRGGAGDPNSGSAVMLEILRGLQEATELGFRPYRSIIFASWDGEEPGLLGSTEWAEDHADWIQKNVVAYMNLDSAVTGNTLLLESSPVLKNLLLNVAKEVEYPKGGTLYEHYQTSIFQGKVPILGSGSDYTVFLEHLGIPSFDLGFACNPLTDPIYQYHLNYDSFYWMETFTDPDFVYHNTISKYLGKIILQLSGPELLQLDMLEYAYDLQSFFDDALKDVPSEWYHYRGKNPHLHELNQDILNFKDMPKFHHGKSFNFVEDFTEAVKLTKKALQLFQKNGLAFDKQRKKLQADLYKPKTFTERAKTASKLNLTNLKLSLVERAFLFAEGLKHRPWFKHTIFASGRYTGYAGQSLPGLREAIEDKDVESAHKWINIHWMTIYAVAIFMSIGL